MKIINHRLHHDDGTPVAFVKTPNVGKAINATWLVMHYTAGSSARESISWLASPDAKASAHLVIARDGTVTQMVAFDRVAWHAGKSTWKGVVGLNSRSIGIELDNPGRLARKPAGWTAFGRVLPEAEVLVATHKNETTSSGWARYPKAQMDAALEVAKLLVKTYGLKDVIGHDDISPGRKQDPGPAFPMESFRAAAMGGGAAPAATPTAPSAPQSAAASPAGTCFRVTTTLNVRGGPSTDAEKVAGSPLSAGTIILCFEDSGDWKRITTRDPVNGAAVAGWASARFLEAAPDEAPPGAVFRATSPLNVRGGPGTGHPPVAAPLEPGTRVRQVEDGGDWKRVTVLAPGGDPTGVTGWVSAKFLERA